MNMTYHQPPFDLVAEQLSPCHSRSPYFLKMKFLFIPQNLHSFKLMNDLLTRWWKRDR